MNTNKQKAFTLIELLVVVTIIGILSGMGIAQFKNSIEKARLAKAKSAAAQFKKQALAANASLENKLFTAWYTFDSDTVATGTGNIQDASGNDNFLSNRNFLQSDDTGIGTGKSLEITNNSVYRPATATIKNEPETKMTIAGWMKRTNQANAYPFFKSTNYDFHSILDGSITFYINSGSSVTSKTGLIKNNQWYFVVGSYDGTTARLWVDGDLVGQENIDLTQNFDSGGLYIGYSNFEGFVDEMMMMPYGWDGVNFK